TSTSNFETLFKERLQTAKETTPLRSLWNQIKQNPKKFNLDPAFLNQFDLENPALRKMLTSLVEKQEHGVQIGTLELDGLKQALKKTNPSEGTGHLTSLPKEAGDLPSLPAAPGTGAPA